MKVLSKSQNRQSDSLHGQTQTLTPGGLSVCRAFCVIRLLRRRLALTSPPPALPNTRCAARQLRAWPAPTIFASRSVSGTLHEYTLALIEVTSTR